MPALNAKDLFALLRADLEPYVQDTLRGIFSVARDPFEVIELLGEAPGRFRVILAWEGEEPLGELATSGIAAHTFKVVVSHNRGLSILRGENRSGGTRDERPLLELAQLVRDRLRSAVMPNQDTGRRLQYRGCSPVRAEVEGAALTQLDAYELRFTLPAALTRFAAEDLRSLTPA